MKDKKNKKYNHAYSVSFSFDSEIADGEEAIKQDEEEGGEEESGESEE